MYRRVLPLLLTAVLLLSGYTAGQKNMPQKTDEKEMTGQPSDGISFSVQLDCW